MLFPVSPSWPAVLVVVDPLVLAHELVMGGSGGEVKGLWDAGEGGLPSDCVRNWFIGGALLKGCTTPTDDDGAGALDHPPLSGPDEAVSLSPPPPLLSGMESSHGFSSIIGATEGTNTCDNTGGS